MGYTTEFYGSLTFNKPVSEQLKDYVNRFSYTRRMKRDNNKIKEIYPNWRELCFFGELGVNGEFFTPESKNFGQENDSSIIEYNDPPSTQPGLWCQWVINDNGELEWDGNEKFYNYIEWLEYLIANFFKPLGYVLNGDINWGGEERDDIGTIHVVDNAISITYGEEVDISDMDTKVLIKELESRGYVITHKSVYV